MDTDRECENRAQPALTQVRGRRLKEAGGKRTQLLNAGMIRQGTTWPSRPGHPHRGALKCAEDEEGGRRRVSERELWATNRGRGGGGGEENTSFACSSSWARYK